MNAVRRVAAWFAAVAIATTPDAARPADAPAPQVSVDASAHYRFRVPDDVVTFHGMVNFDTAGLGDNSMLYTGGPIGLVAGVVAHAIVSDARRKRQKDEMQARADEVLAPYADGLANFGQHDLFDRSLPRMLTPGTKGAEESVPAAPDGWTVEYAPAFAMIRDGRAIVLDNVVTVVRGGDAPYRNTIRVVSAAQVDDPEAFWSADDLANLKAESARLLALSFDIALDEARRASAGTQPTPQRTLRYRFGRDERMERGELVAESCERIVMHTLRGWVLSAPVAQKPPTDSAGHACAGPVVAGS